MHLLFRQEGPLGGTKVALVSANFFFFSRLENDPPGSELLYTYNAVIQSSTEIRGCLAG